ncbi:MAG: hypothetical protein V4550_14070 [Gemmatimonadota bacterium]
MIRSRVMGCLVVLSLAATAHAQATDRERVASALADLGPRFAQQFDYRPGWFRDTAIRYYDFGPVAQGVADVYWPIHGFAPGGDPVPLRAQAPVFSTVPELDGYTSMWRLHYVIVADHVHPNELRSVDQITRLVAQKRAVLRDAGATLNLPIVPRGSWLEGKEKAGTQHGWFDGTAVAYFDFGVGALTPAPIFPFFRPAASNAEPASVEGQRNVVDVVPDGATPSLDLWDVHRVSVDAAYAANTIRNLSALRAAEAEHRLSIVKAGSIRNCPVALVGDRPVERMASPLTRFAIASQSAR